MSAVAKLRAIYTESALKPAPVLPNQTPAPAVNKGVGKANNDEFDIPDEVQGQATTEAAKQTNAVRELQMTKLVNQFNEDHFVSTEGGTTNVYVEAYDNELKRPKLDCLSTSAFMALYANKGITFLDRNEKLTRISTARAWFYHKERRTFSKGIELLPNMQAPAGVYNLWRGFGCEPRPNAVIADVRPALVHLKQVICSGNDEQFKYALAWLAFAVQHPGKQAEVAIVLQGDLGTGKGTLLKWFRELFGSHGMLIQHPRHLTGNFNAHLQTCLALGVDEAFFVGDKAGNGVLKSLITEDQITVEKKGIDVFSIRNRLKIIMATNADHAVLAGGAERRYFVLRVSDVKKQDHDYFGMLDSWWNNGGKEALLGYLLEYDLTGFNIRKVPNTAALEQQKLQSLPPIDAWLYERLCEPDWVTERVKESVMAAISAYAKDHGSRWDRVSNESVGKKLADRVGAKSSRQASGSRLYIWVFPELSEARKIFAASLGLKHTDWPIEAAPHLTKNLVAGAEDLEFDKDV